MVSGLATAQRLGLGAGHLWRTDSPTGCAHVFRDEKNGARACNLESLFAPIDGLPPFTSHGESIRFLYEQGNQFYHRDLNVVDEVCYPCVGFATHGPLTEAHLAGVDAVLVMTSLNFPVAVSEKIALYGERFAPRAEYLRLLEAHHEVLAGRWLCVHLRSEVRTAFSAPEWSMGELIEKTSDALCEFDFDRIIVFSDVDEFRREFMAQTFGDVPVRSIDWGEQPSVQRMFLDFLAMSRASLILGSGLSSFSYEAGLFGGGVPVIDMCQGLLWPEAPSGNG